jgi:TatD DNase family protein
MIAAGVTRSVQIGTDWETSRKALELSRVWGANSWCAVGIHPTSCQKMPPASIEASVRDFEELIQRNRDKVVAVGETGLDYYHLDRGNEKEQKSVQHRFFRAQAALALRLDLPLIVHTRDAAADTIALIRETGTKHAVIHCFSENLQFGEELLRWSDDIFFSFSGILTYDRSAAVKAAARSLPLDRILVETDAPFLVPRPVHDVHDVNEPAFTGYVLDCLKTLRDEHPDMVERTVWDNSNSFFRIAEKTGD